MRERLLAYVQALRGPSPRLASLVRMARRVLLPVFVGALTYVLYRVFSDLPMIRKSLVAVPVSSLLWAGVAAMLGVGARAAYRLALYVISGHGRARLPYAVALQSFAWGQLMRYVPGKIAGPATEVVLLDGYVGWTKFFRITVFETAAMLLLSLFWLLASAFYLSGHAFISAMLLSLGVAAIWTLHRWRPGLDASHESSLAPGSACWVATAMLVAEWVFYYFVWIAIAPSDWFRLATAYGAATWLSSLVFVSPAGLGVRELAFTEILPHLALMSRSDVLAQALIIRFVQTLADILFPLLVLAWSRGARHG